MGAGSVGCWVGGRLAAGGHDVVFVGRAALGEVVAAHGLTLSDHESKTCMVPSPAWALTPDVLADVDLVLVCVKGLATRDVAAALAPVVRSEAVVVSLQNGVANAEALAASLEAAVFAGMVPFNLVNLGEGRFHRGTSGELVVDAALAGHPRGEEVLAAFSAAALPLRLHASMSGVLWGKLLVNLNNALNALSDRPLVEELRDLRWRRVLAATMAEGLAALDAAGIEPITSFAVAPWLVPHVLRLPTPLFTVVARRMIAIDPTARSSMWEDLQRGRSTEVGMLNGSVVELGKCHGVPTPVNRAVCDTIRAAERGEDVQERVSALQAMV